jgi:hypothetical protein
MPGILFLYGRKFNNSNTRAMAELKTKKSDNSVSAFLGQIDDEQKRKDALAIDKLMEAANQTRGKMWGSAIVGYGDKHLKYESGRELDWFVMGFSPRKQNFALYIPGAVEKRQAFLKKLGKYKTGKGCLYINSLEDIDIKVLTEIIKKGLS